MLQLDMSCKLNKMSLLDSNEIMIGQNSNGHSDGIYPHEDTACPTLMDKSVSVSGSIDFFLVHTVYSK